MTYNMPQDLRAKPQIIKGVDLISFVVVVIGAVLGYTLSVSLGLVSDRLSVVFNIFNVAVLIFLEAPSIWNKGKKNYQSIIFALVNDKYTYHETKPVLTSAESCIKTPLLTRQVEAAARELGVDLKAIQKEMEEEEKQAKKAKTSASDKAKPDAKSKPEIRQTIARKGAGPGRHRKAF